MKGCNLRLVIYKWMLSLALTFILMSQMSNTNLVKAINISESSVCYIDSNKNDSLDEGETVYSSLQNAIDNANEGDIIVLLTDIITDSTTNIQANADIHINGKGHTIQASVTGINENGLIDANATYIHILSNSGNLTLSNLTIYGGSDSAITNSGTLRMTGCVVERSGNSFCSGGAIYNSGTAYLDTCNLSGNVAGFGGGFVCSGSGIIILESCSITENRSQRGGGGCEINSQAKAIMNYCTVANNQGNEIGGGINVYGGTVYLLNSTISGNVSGDDYLGGGIGVNGGNLYAINSVIANNYHKGERSDLGIFSVDSDSKIQLQNCAYGNIEEEEKLDTCQSKLSDIVLLEEEETFGEYEKFPRLNLDGSGTGDFYNRPKVEKQDNGTYIVPLDPDSPAVTGGTWVFWDISDLSDIKAGYYDKNTQEIIAVGDMQTLNGVSVPSEENYPVMGATSKNETTDSFTKTECDSVAVAIDVPAAGSPLDMVADCSTTGVSVEGMRVSYTKTGSDNAAAVSGNAEYNTAYTASITLTALEGYQFTSSTTATVNGNTATVQRNDDGTLTVNYAFPATAKAKLLSMKAPADIKGLPNGTAKTAEALGLPGKVSIRTEDSNVTSANVTWDLENPVMGTYDPAVLTEQTFTVSGTVELPEEIDQNGVNLKTTIQVTVTAAEDTKIECDSVAVAIDVPAAGSPLDMVADCSTTGVSVEGMRVSYTKTGSDNAAAVSGNAEYNTAYTASITLTALEGYQFTSSTTATVNGNTATVQRNDDGTLTVNYAFPATAKAKLLSMKAPADIKGLPNGTAKTAEALGLPGKVSIRTEDSNVTSANVTWDLENPVMGTYDPAVLTEQTFTVSGTVELPEEIDQNGVNLKTTIQVTVMAADTRKEPFVTKEQMEQNAATMNHKTKVTASQASIKVTWGKVSGAAGYDIFAASCGSKKLTLAASADTKKTSVTIKKISNKKTNAKGNYKVKVKAYRMVNGTKEYIASGLLLHVAASKNQNYTNAKSIKVNKKVYTLKKGKTAKIKATIVKQNKKKKLLSKKHGKQLRYNSSDKSVATISTTGKITAKKKGICYIYVTALNGVNKKIKVTVK